MQASKPINLGSTSVAFQLSVGAKKRTNSGPSNYVTILTFIGLLGGIGGAVGFLAASGAFQAAGGPSEQVTPVPSVSPTLSPTVSPTKYPTQSPTGPTTQSPTIPTASPSPGSGCASVDAVCGCDQIQSALLDILFIVDESGSIAVDDFELQKEAAINFINKTAVVGEYGSRFGWMEFQEYPDTGGIIGLTDFNKADLMAEIDTKTLSTGWTRQDRALTEALSFFQDEDNSFRNGSQRVIIFLTDGQPCCNAPTPSMDPVDELKAIADTLAAKTPPEPFLFYYLPITPRTGYGSVDVNLFDGNNGLVFNETFFKFEEFAFSELNAKLTTELVVPLGPCITIPPTLL